MFFEQIHDIIVYYIWEAVVTMGILNDPWAIGPPPGPLF